MGKFFRLFPRARAPAVRPARTTQPKRITWEHAVATAGICFACASGVFAISKLSEDPRANDLAIAASSPWRMVSGTGRTDGPGVDDLVTGSIPRGTIRPSTEDRQVGLAPVATIADAGAVDTTNRPLPGFTLRDVFQGLALVEGPAGFSEVKQGSYLLGAGRVTSIEQRAGKWVVVTSEGLIEDPSPQAKTR